MRAKPLPSQEVLNSLFSYSVVSGQLRHKIGCRVGQVAGHKIPSTGYVEVKIGGRKGARYLAHRVIWKMVTGTEPNHIDHRNLDRCNAWHNLRDGTKAQNQGNRAKRTDNISGYKNIDWDTRRGRWRVQIKSGDRRAMKRTRTLAGAIAYQRLMSGCLFGEFARST